MALKDTSEAKRVYGGGVPMSPMGTSSDDQALMNAIKLDESKAKPEPQRGTLYDPTEFFKRQEAARRRNAMGPSSGPDGGDGGDPPKGKTLEEHEDKMRADYKASGENYLKKNQPKSLKDFQKSEAAQTDFAQAAAIQDFNKLANANDEDYEALPFTIGDKEYDVFTFNNGSEFIVFEDADINNLMPGDVLRLNPPASKGG